MLLGLPAELPQFQSKRQLGEVTVSMASSAQDVDNADCVYITPAVAAASSEAVVYATPSSADDSLVLDMDMDETC